MAKIDLILESLSGSHVYLQIASTRGHCTHTIGPRWLPAALSVSSSQLMTLCLHWHLIKAIIKLQYRLI